ncbi:MAG: alpha/beta hydrolase [Coprobacillus sp.]
MRKTNSYTSIMHTHVRYYVYEPKVVLRVKGVVQIHHGLSEHADRYEHFASFLLNQGFVVVVSDFAGHGKSLIDFEQGYFGKNDGPDNLVKDMFHLQEIIRRSYPDTPYFMLGVDLGSIMIRKYMSQYGDFIDGALLLGTMAKVENRYSKRIYLSALKTIKGPMYKSQSYFQKIHHQYNSKIKHNQTDVDYLTSDEHERSKYLKDPMTHFTYTVQGYKDIVKAIYDVNTDAVISQIPKHISLYVGIGEHDILAKNVDKLVDKYKNLKLDDITFKVYKDMRHALLFEKNKLEVYKDILKWLNERTYL